MLQSARRGAGLIQRVTEIGKVETTVDVGTLTTPNRGVLALLVAGLSASIINRSEAGSELIQLVAAVIQQSAHTLPCSEYWVLALFVAAAKRLSNGLGLRSTGSCSRAVER
jgi:hypothetical protein